MNRNRLIMGIGAVTSVAALTLAVTTLPAMAGRPQHRPPTPPTHKVAAPTTSATYGYSLTLTGLPGSSAPLGISGTATIDLTGQQAQLTANLSRAIGPIGTGTITAIVANHTVYVDAPGLGVLTGGKSWVSVSSHTMAVAGPATALWNKLGVAIADVPAALAWATTHPSRHPLVTVTSTANRAGSTITELQMVVPHGKAKAAGSGLPTTVPVTVTADAQGRLSAISSSFSAAGVAISFTATSTGFDAPVVIVPPAASDTFILSPSMLAMAAGLLGLPAHQGPKPTHAVHVVASGLSSRVHAAGAKISTWLHSLDHDAH